MSKQIYVYLQHFLYMFCISTHKASLHHWDLGYLRIYTKLITDYFSLLLDLSQRIQPQMSTNEPPHDRTNNMACAPSEDSDQPGHPPSLIRVFAVRMKTHCVFSYTLSAQRRIWSDWTDAQAGLNLRWAHSHFVGFVMRRLKFSIFISKGCQEISQPSLLWLCVIPLLVSKLRVSVFKMSIKSSVDQNCWHYIHYII